jgi:integrase
MASVNKRANGRKAIKWYYEKNKPPKTIFLGKMDFRQAQNICTKIEELQIAKTTNQSISPEVAGWLKEVGNDLYEKLVNAELVQARKANLPTALGQFVQDYIDKKTGNVNESTVKVYLRCKKHLVKYFGAGKLINQISAGDANDWKLAIGKKLSKNTVGRTCGVAEQFFADAVDHEVITKNPFAGLAEQPRGNPARQFFITKEMADKVIEHCPDNQWKLLFALSRFAGLRCPSEHLALKWTDINWAENRLTINAPKLKGKQNEKRIIPIFPEIRPYLDQEFADALEGSVHVITKYRKSNSNLRTQLERIIQRAGLKAWPKLFQNLRASCETDLMKVKGFSLHTVLSWMGHTRAVSFEHYAMDLEPDFEKAAKTIGGGNTAMGTAIRSQPGQSGELSTIINPEEIDNRLQSQG